MIRQPLENLLASSTAAHVNRFLRETQLSGSVPSLVAMESVPHFSPASNSELLNMGSTPQLDVQVAPESPDQPRFGNNNNAYKNLLKYKPNESFKGELSSINGVSVPNTFKHKSHPNAQTKDRIGLSATAEEHLSVDNESLHPVRTSTMKSISIPNDLSQENTPTWMPPELEQKWDENSEDLPSSQFSLGSQRANFSRPGAAELDFLNSESNTFVHNAPASDQGPISTPVWKKMSHEYQAKALQPLQSIFQSADDSSEKDLNKDVLKSRNNSKTGHSALTLFLTTSTPVANRDSDVHLTQQQIHQLEDMLEKAKDQPDDYQIKGSPLKLFGSDYDTFTKAILTKFVDKVRSNASSIQREQQPVQIQLSAPKLNIKNFTKFGDYTDQDFKKNANNLFANIQKKAHNGSNIFNKPSNESLSFHKSLTQNHTTATSTPKAHKTHDFDELKSIDGYSPYSTDFDESSSAGELREKQESTMGDRHEYTSIEKTYLSGEKPETLEEFPIRDDNASSYTFDDLTDLEETEGGRKQSSETGGLESSSQVNGMSPSENRSLQLDHSMSSVRKYWSSPKLLSHTDEDSDFGATEADQSMQHIMWRRASQLKLQNNSRDKKAMRSSSVSNIVKGTVKPGNFPEKYGDMVFDFKNNKWISNDKENDYPGSLDSIEDLFTESEDQNISATKKQREPSILKLKDRPLRDKNLEVSFQVPDTTSESAGVKNPVNVTQVSELGDVTFTQSNKKLISLITGSTDESTWETVSTIDLSNNNLERVEGLEEFLPSIKRLNVANNHLEFIEGLPEGLRELNLADNLVSNITSFKKFKDLEILDVLSNSLKSLTGLTYNLHLTKLDLSNNRVKSLDGLGSMSNLMYLDLSSNEFLGHINLAEYNFRSMETLKLSDNRIQSISGIETAPKLRILNASDNSIERISCIGRHSHLKKLVLKFNRLKRLELECFPFIRILRIDGNSLEFISDLRKLKYLQEVSAKCQDSPRITEQVVLETCDVVSLDLSGNHIISSLLSPKLLLDIFANLNQLNLSAVGLEILPSSFGESFSNVRELNVNFNKLTNLEGLSKLCRLRKVTAVSNNMSKMEMILSSLQNSRRTLKQLDLRLNIFNFDFYPHVFSPHELDIAGTSDLKKLDSSPIPLESYDDIENFSIHYNTLVKSREEWESRDADFFKKLRSAGNYKCINERLSYETILIKFFPKLKDLDGSQISIERRSKAESRIHIRGD